MSGKIRTSSFKPLFTQDCYLILYNTVLIDMIECWFYFMFERFFLATMEAALEHILANQLGVYLQSRITKVF